jgi:hypothetical protein
MRRGSWRGWGLGAVAVACAAALVGWNVSRFVGSQARIREKQLDFLPAPVVAEMLCLGHRNSVAKLRWIDSFAYFQYLLDSKDDRVKGSVEGGFERLYETLVALDPHFQPFYEHAALSLSGVLERHGEALAFLQRGIEANPGRSELWRNAATLLHVMFHWQERMPRQFDAFLAAWEAAETTADGKRMVWDWKRQMARRFFRDLEQLPYWFDQLARNPPGTPGGDYVEATIREQLARFGTRELSGLVGAYRVARGGKADRLIDLFHGLALFDPLALPAVDPDPHNLADLLDPRLVAACCPHGLPSFGPLVLEGGRLRVRTDPFGLPWRLEHGTVVSGGFERRAFERDLAEANIALLGKARERGRWPGSLDEVRALGIPVPDPGIAGTVTLDGQALVVAWTQRAEPPWPLR